MDGVNDLGMIVAQGLIHVIIKRRYSRGLPVVQMDDIGAQLFFEHEFHGGTAEIEIAFDVVFAPIKAAPVEEIAGMMRLDEIDFQVFYPPQPYRILVPFAIVKGHKALVVYGEVPDTIAVHAVIFRYDDVDVMAFPGNLPTKSQDNICKASNFGNRGQFRGDVYAIHRNYRCEQSSVYKVHVLEYVFRIYVTRL